SPIQVTLLACFVELFCGIAVDTMFGRKLQKLTGVSRSKIITAQIIGLIASAITVSLIIWFVSNNGLLAKPPLIAQRAYTRSLLVKVHDFDINLILIGMLYSAILYFFTINPVLVISGLLMPLDYIIPLVIGGLISMLFKN